MKITIEFLTLKQGYEVFELLRPLLAKALSGEGRKKVSVVRGGSLQRLAIDEPGRLIDTLKGERSNEVRITWASAPSRPQAFRLLEATLYISPTSSAWLSTADFPRDGRIDASMARSIASTEGSFIWNGIAAAPTLLEVGVEVDPNSLHETSTEILHRFFSGMTVPLEIFGWAGFRRSEAFDPNVLDRLAPWPKALPMLGSRFDALHPILFGSRGLCEQVEEAFRSELERPAVEIPAAGESVWIVALPEDLLEKAKGESFEFLVPRDETTKPREADPALGEYELRGTKVFTRKRRRELAAMGLRTERLIDHEPTLVVSESFCELAGIDPDDVIEVDLHERNIPAIKAEIEKRFSALGPDLPLRERIWLAHRGAYGEWLGGHGFFGPVTSGVLDHIQSLLIQ